MDSRDALERILLDPRVRDSKLMIVSVTGGAKIGNSFLLNIFLKYLKNLGAPDWLDDPDVPVEGFAWGGGRDRTTKGILLWSEPFFIKVPSGEDVCILLMDTYSISSLMGMWTPSCDIILPYMSLLTSVQIFSPNCLFFLLSQFKSVMDYGKLAMEVFKEKPFQTFYVVIRDMMVNNNEKQEQLLGFEGGENFWKNLMKPQDGDSTSTQEKKNLFCKNFKDLRCYVMPFPGQYVQKAKSHFCMSDKGINPEFKSSLKTLTEHIFDPKNIIIKEINGKKVTGKELFQYFKSYSKVFDGENPPVPKALIKAGDEARKIIAETKDVYFPNHWGLKENSGEPWDVIAVDKAADVYRREMNKIYDEDLCNLNNEILNKNHEKIYYLAMNKLRRMGFVGQIYEDNLSQRLLELRDYYRKDIECLKADLNSPSLTSAFTDGRLRVFENKKGQ